MRLRVLTPEISHDTAAAALIKLSQTPPQQVAMECEDPKTPSTVGRHLVPTSPSTPGSNMIKVSNSDDEDMSEEVSTFDRGTVTNEVTESALLQQVHFAEQGAAQRPARLTHPTRLSWPASGFELSAVSGPSSASVQDTSRASNGDELMRASSAREHLNPDLFPRLQGVEADRLRYYLSSTPWTDKNAATASPSGRMFSSFECGRSNFRTQDTTLSCNVSAEHRQPVPQHSARAEPVSPSYIADAYRAPIIPNDTAVPHRSVSEGAIMQVNIRNFRAPHKRAITPPRDNAAKRPRDGFESTHLDITDFKYRTIKAIRMPPRECLAPGQEPPEPTPDHLPYGNDIDYPTSMLVYWLDDLELTYTESARRFRLRFPGETSTDDTVRKKHHMALIKLAKRYGLKADHELVEPSKSIMRRGQQAGRRYKTIGGKVVYSASAGPDLAGTVRRNRPSELTADRGFLKACICVWKDTSDVGFEHIQHRLASQYNWHIGTNTVQKLYYAERGRVYGTHGDAGQGLEEELDSETTN